MKKGTVVVSNPYSEICITYNGSFLLYKGSHFIFNLLQFLQRNIGNFQNLFVTDRI